MTNSIDQPCADEIINPVFELLAGSYLTETIDAPIQRAVEAFDYRSQEADPYIRFIDTVSHFFGHIAKRVNPFDEKPSSIFLQQEWMYLVEQGYRTAHGTGFTFAYLDALEDIEPVLSRIAGILISHLRERHTQSVYSKWIAGLGWAERCKIVKTLFEQNPHLPEVILRCPIPSMVDCIPRLIADILSAQETVRQLWVGETDTFTV